MIEVLWNRRALFSLGDQTVVRLLDGKGGQTPVQILEGNVRIAYSYNEGHPTDTLTVLTPEARTVMRGGILEALVGSGIQTDDRRLTTFGRAEEGGREAGRGDVIRIVEGQASVEPASSGTKPVLLKAGHETRVIAAGSDIPRQYNGEHRQRLAAIAGHQEVPQLTVQRIAGIHVEHALELEQGLRKNAEDVKNAQSSDSRVKGAILWTSLGIPVTRAPGFKWKSDYGRGPRDHKRSSDFDHRRGVRIGFNSTYGPGADSEHQHESGQRAITVCLFYEKRSRMHSIEPGRRRGRDRDETSPDLHPTCMIAG